MKKQLTPSELQTKCIPSHVSGYYNWKKQMYQYDSCKFGTTSYTTNGTSTGQYNMQDDSTTDSFTD